MAHIGKDFPKHWRRDMALGVPARWQWPMYFEGHMTIRLQTENPRNYELSPKFLTEPDWDGLSMSYTSPLVTDQFYGEQFQFDLRHEWLEGGRTLRTWLELFSVTFGFLMQGPYDRPQPFRDDSLIWLPTAETEFADIVYPGPGIVPALIGPQASWTRWKALYPGQEPWKPPQP